MNLIVITSIIFILYSIYISNDLFNPLVLFVFPILISIFFHSLQLSDYYTSNDNSIVFILSLIPVFFSIGFIFFYVLKKRFSKVSLQIDNLKTRVSSSRLNKSIIALNSMALLTFLLEASIVTPALISNAPTHSYMNFGLPILHHFVNLLLLSVSLSVINYKLFNKKRLFYITLVLSIVIFSFIMARMMILLVLLVVFFTFYYFSKKNYKKIFLILFTLSLIFYYGFSFLGELRTLTTLNENYFYEMANFNNQEYSTVFVQIYMYLTINFQNLYNLLLFHENYYFGLYTFLNLLPLIDANVIFDIDTKQYQSHIGLTTFMFGKLIIMDFGYFFLLFIFLFGYGVAYVYYNFIRQKIFFIFFYIVVLMKGLLMAFFSDALFGSSLLINSIAILVIVKYIRTRSIINENIISK